MTAPIHGQHSYYEPQSAVPRKRRIWPWVAGAVLLAVACGFGGVALLAGSTVAAIDAGVKAVEVEASSRGADITITKCETDDLLDFGTVTVSYTLTNSSVEARSYVPEFDIVAADLSVIGSATDFVQEIEPHGTFRGKAQGIVSERPRGKVTCKLRSA